MFTASTKSNLPPLIFFTFYMLILISVIVKKIVTINSRLSEIKINSRTIIFVPLTVKLVSTNASALEKARRKYWFHPSPIVPSSHIRATCQKKSLWSNSAFKMVYYPIVALLAHMGGYMLRKTFVATSFRMNALIKLQVKHAKFHGR